MTASWALSVYSVSEAFVCLRSKGENPKNPGFYRALCEPSRDPRVSPCRMDIGAVRFRGAGRATELPPLSETNWPNFYYFLLTFAKIY